MVKNYFIIIFVAALSLKAKAQDTTLTFTKAEFQKVKFLKQALGSFPSDCKITYYKMSMNLKGSEKVAIFDVKDPESASLPNAFIGIIQKEGGTLNIEKVKTGCASNRYNKSFKIVVN